MTIFAGSITKVESHTDTDKASVHFAKSGNNNPYIESQSNNWMTGNFWGSVLVVAKVPSQSKYSCFLSQGRDSHRRNICFGFHDGSKMVVDSWDGGPLTHHNVRRNDWTVYTYVMRYYWTHWYNHYYTYFYVNNVSQDRGRWGTQNYYTTANKLRLGSWRTTDNNYKFLGDIAEVITWNRLISTADRQYVNDRMCAKYVCKNLKYVEGANFVKTHNVTVRPYETQATANHVYTHPAHIRTGG